MRKWYLLEIGILVVILVAAIIACSFLATTAFSDTPPATTTPTTTETVQETTEPQPTWMTFPSDRELTAQQAFVYDCNLDEFQYLSGTENDKVYPASITKLMTAYVALQFLDADLQITAGDALDLVGPGSSVAEIKKGDVLTTSQLVTGLLLPSGNDAAYLLAVEAGRVIKNDQTLSPTQAVKAFMNEVNGQMRSLGMTGSNFTNPDGYHEYEHFTCIADLVTIGQLAVEHPVILDAVKVYEAEVALPDRTLKWENTNFLVVPGSEYECVYALGLKTGQTPDAGSCLLSAFDVEGQKYIIGVFGCPDIPDRFEDTLQLLNSALGIE